MSKGDETATRQTGITGITIENFKGISAAATIPLRPITLLFGANSSGKSTIIQAIHYARELVQRNNPNADIPMAGGNAIDFGGFRNLVHGHELSRTIRIGFDLTPDDDGLPNLAEITGLNIDIDADYWQTLERNRIVDSLLPDLVIRLQNPETNFPDTLRRLEAVKKSHELVSERKPDISPFIDTVGIRLAVSWDGAQQSPWLSEASYFLNGRVALTIRQENDGAIPYITEVDCKHPSIKAVFAPILPENPGVEVPAAVSEFENFFRVLQDSQGRVLLKGQLRAIPDLAKPLPLDVSFETEDGEYGYEFFIAAIVNQIVLGTTALLQREFDQFRYVGPIRERPQRDHRPPAVVDEARWADGSAAWDLILKHYDPATQKGNAFVQEISQWMSQEDKLDLGYSLDVTAYRNLPEDSLLMANLRLLREQFEEKDQEFYKKLIWPAIENSEIEPRLELRDLKNDVSVGPTDLGIGVIQVIPVIAASVDGSKRIVAIEQPELHLHPRVACNLGDLFIAQIPAGKLFLIESHSEHLMLRLKRRIREKTIRPEDVSVLFVEAPRGGVGRTHILNLRLDSEGEFLDEWPGGFFEEDFNEIFTKGS